jgi:hypothetical protein
MRPIEVCVTSGAVAGPLDDINTESVELDCYRGCQVKSWPAVVGRSDYTGTESPSEAVKSCRAELVVGGSYVRADCCGDRGSTIKFSETPHG